MRAPSGIHQRLRLFLWVTLGVLAVATMSAARCAVRLGDDDLFCDEDDEFDDDAWDDDDDLFDDDDDLDDDDIFDDDDSCDDDDDDDLAQSLDRTPRRETKLQHFRTLPAPPGDPRPFARMIEIRGISLLQDDPRIGYGEREIERFTARLIADNPEWLAVPGSGGLQFLGARFYETAIVAGWGQPIRGAHLSFLFDLHGELREIDNATRPGGAAADAR